jgi:pSer/pThr/pTyr-binding forkhead associated (FHA) protein
MPDSVIIFREPLEPFALACGGGRPLVLTVRRRMEGVPVGTYTFDQPFVRIGRGVNNDLVLPGEAVSFRHVYLQRIEGKWACLDLRSTARARYRTPSQPFLRWLDECRKFDVGPFTISPQTDGGGATATQASVSSNLLAPSVSACELTLVNRSSQYVRRITRPLTLIGSARQCDLWLKDSSVSRIHASLVLTPRGLWIVDLLGRHGVMVDGRRVRWKQISDGSRLEIGRFSFRVRLESAAPPTEGPSAQAAEPSEPVLPESMGAISGNLTRDFVMGVLRHLTESRVQFFEHLQFQSNLIHELLSQLRSMREAPPHPELQRIDEIHRELMEVKRQLAGIDLTPPPIRLPEEPRISETELSTPSETPPAAPEADMPEGAAVLEMAAPLQIPEERNASASPVTGDQPVARELSMGAASEEHETVSSTVTQSAHALLSERLSKIAHERNSRWRRMFRLFCRD